MKHLITLEDVYKSYRRGEVDIPVLQGVALEIERGELVALVGTSGSGKSTLMNILGCLDRPTSGKYWLDGHEVSAFSALTRPATRSGLTSRSGIVVSRWRAGGAHAGGRRGTGRTTWSCGSPRNQLLS